MSDFAFLFRGRGDTLGSYEQRQKHLICQGIGGDSHA